MNGIQKKNYFWNMVYSLLNAAQSALLLSLVNHVLKEEASGVFGFSFSVALLFMFVGNYGIRNFQVSDVAEKYAHGEYYAARLISILLMAVSSVVYLALCGYQEEKAAVIAALLLWRAAECVEDVFHGRYQQRGKLYVAGIQGSIRLLAADLIFAAALLMGCRMGTAAFLFAAVSAVFVLVFALLTLPKFGGFSLEFRSGAWGRLLAETFPLFLNYFLITYLANVSKYAMEYFTEDTEQAYFNMLFTPVLVVNLLSTMVFRPLITEMAEQLKKGEVTKYRALVRRQEGAIVLIGLAVLAGTYFLGLPVLSLFYGSDLSVFRLPLLLLMAGGIFSAFSSFYNVCLVTLRGQIQVLILTTISAGAAYLLHYKFAVVLLHRLEQTKLMGLDGAALSASEKLAAAQVSYIMPVAVAFLASMLLQAALYAVLHARLTARAEKQ